MQRIGLAGWLFAAVSLFSGCVIKPKPANIKWTNYGFQTFNVLEHSQTELQIGLRDDGVVVWRPKGKSH